MSSAKQVTAVFIVLATMAPPVVADDAGRIRDLRAASNAAIAAHDLEALVAFQHDAYQITTGNGTLLQESRAETLAALERIFAQADDVLYVRTPGAVEVGDGGRRAYEAGTWRGTWSTAEGATDIGGRYAAYWLQVEGEWKLLSELFVTLRCTGPDCG